MTITDNTVNLQSILDTVNALPENSGSNTSSFIRNRLNGQTLDALGIKSGGSGVLYTYESSKNIDKIIILWGNSGLVNTVDFFNYSTSSTNIANAYLFFGINTTGYDTKYTLSIDPSTLNVQYTAGSGWSTTSPHYGSIVFVKFIAEDETEEIDSFLLNYNSMYCYLRNTLITLSNNSTKKVQDITYDDELLVWDFDNGKFTSAKPLWIKVAEQATQYYHCVFSNGTTLDLVGGRGHAHRVFCLDTNRFEYANDCVGRTVMTQNGATSLLSCDVISNTVEFYNIITDYHMNVYANEILTSTGLSNIYPVEDMKYIKEDRQLIPIGSFDNCPYEYYHGLRLGEQINYTMERLNEKVAQLVSAALPNGNE